MELVRFSDQSIVTIEDSPLAMSAKSLVHTRGDIFDPKSKAKSVVLSEEGERMSRELFVKYFALRARSRADEHTHGKTVRQPKF